MGPLPGEIVHVYVTLAEGTPLAIVDAHAWRVQNRDEASRTVEAWVPVARLNGLASVPGVTIIDVVSAPEVRTGSVTAQSDAICWPSRSGPGPA